jgi:DNA-directed RNA polymerase specialized sigma24 family protein
MLRPRRQMAKDDEGSQPVYRPPPFEKRLDVAIHRRDLMPHSVIYELDVLEDMMQEAAIRAARKWEADPHAFDVPGSLEAYIQSVARDLALAYSEKCENVRARERAYQEEQERAARERMDPAALIEALDTYHRVGSALNGFARYVRGPWLVFKGEAISLVEAAALCDVTPEALRRYLTIGAKRLRDGIIDSRRDGSARSSSEVPAQKTKVPNPDNIRPHHGLEGGR